MTDAARHIASSEVPIARAGERVGDVRARMRERGRIELDVDRAFLLDGDDRVLGALPLLALLAADDDAPVDPLAREAPQVARDVDQEHAAMQAIHHGVASVAVVDDEGRLVGAIGPSSLMLVLHREHVEDVQKLAGIVHETAQAEHALADPPLRRARHRLPWLLVGLAGGAVATAVSTGFEAALRAQVAIAFFIPAIVYLAGAMGAQTGAVAVRFLSFGAERARIGPLLRGELMTGLALGVSLGALAGAGVWAGFGDGRLALAVALSIVAAGAIATTTGLLVPWALARRGADPAFGSGPLATVIQDVLSLLVYFSIVTALAAR